MNTTPSPLPVIDGYTWEDPREFHYDGDERTDEQREQDSLFATLPEEEPGT